LRPAAGAALCCLKNDNQFVFGIWISMQGGKNWSSLDSPLAAPALLFNAASRSKTRRLATLVPTFGTVEIG
jgi:hypothetical protein